MACSPRAGTRAWPIRPLESVGIGPGAHEPAEAGGTGQGPDPGPPPPAGADLAAIDPEWKERKLGWTVDWQRR